MESKVNAVMLRAADYNENDKILTLLTAEEGKISASIKGVKKAGAKLKFAAQPFCFAEYILSERAGRRTVIGCSEQESFYDLRADINKFYAASSAAEAALNLTYEGEECSAVFYALINAFTEMCQGDESLALIKFLLAALKSSGYATGTEVCPHCGAPLVNKQKLRFDMTFGSFACEECCAAPRASLSTYNIIRGCLGKPHGDETAPDAPKRALKLLYGYAVHKTEARLTALSEYIALLR